MKLSMLSAAAVAAFASFGAAENCDPQYRYCASVLLAIGNYDTQIRNAVADAEGEFPGITRENALFDCTGGSNGEIEVVEKCGYQCKDGGSGHSDSC
ncbi:hypothetical protein BJX99DRAFT_271515 [Aspergillus californicus]